MLFSVVGRHQFLAIMCIFAAEKMFLQASHNCYLKTSPPVRRFFYAGRVFLPISQPELIINYFEGHY